MVLQHELILRALRVVTPPDPSVDDLALDVIAESARGGTTSRIATRGSTCAISRCRFRCGAPRRPAAMPSVCPRGPPAASGTTRRAPREPSSTASCASHHPEPLPDDVLAGLGAVLAAAEEDAARLAG